MVRRRWCLGLAWTASLDRELNRRRGRWRGCLSSDRVVVGCLRLVGTEILRPNLINCVDLRLLRANQWLREKPLLHAGHWLTWLALNTSCSSAIIFADSRNARP